MRKTLWVAGLVTAATIALQGTGSAQTFPPDSAWLPLMRNGVPLTDPIGDAQGYRDTVGDAQNPSAFIYSDGVNLFFRLRLAESPIKNPPADIYQPFAWSCIIDTDANHTTYELLAGVDGNANPDVVTLQQNLATTSPNSPADRTELVLATYTPLNHSRVVPAGSALDGNPDFFLDWAVNWSDMPIVPGAPFRVTCGSSNGNNNLNADLLSPDNSTTLSGTNSDPVICTATGCVACNTDNACGDSCLPCAGVTPRCDPASRSCVQCVSNDQCGGLTPACNLTTHTCVPCRGDSDCSGASPACQPTGACGQCSATNDVQCVGTTPVCNVVTGTCRGCLGDADCTDPAAPACQLDGSCGQCSLTNAGQCVGNTPACDTSTGTCVGCRSDTDCGNPLFPACQPDGTCGQCSALNINLCVATGQVCNTALGLCVPPGSCTSDADCTDPARPACGPTGVCGQCSATNDTLCTGNTPICDTGSSTCRACQGDADCTEPTAPACLPSGRCGECRQGNTTLCTGTTPICNIGNGTCVACQNDPQCTDPAHPACEPDGSCNECSATNQLLCTARGQICNTSLGLCVPPGGCDSDVDCTDPALPACEPTGVCGQCSATNSSLCTGGTPVCELTTGTCRGCIADTECPAGNVCDVAAGVCRTPCTTSQKCSPPTPICDNGRGLCIGCNTGADCSGNTPICDPDTNLCVPCSGDADCNDPARPACQPGGSCGQCSVTNSTSCVDPTPLCNVVTGNCVDGCRNDTDCAATPNTPFCDTNTRACVGCRGNDDCAGTRPYCNPTGQVCEPCAGSGPPFCTDPQRPVCQTQGNLAGACTQCSEGETGLCTPTEPICLTDLGLCGCRDTDGDSECGSTTSGTICNGPAGICVPGCSTAPGRNNCPSGQTCNATGTMVGMCIDSCSGDGDCEPPLGRCDTSLATPQCVQCLGDGDCASPYICDLTTNTCRECTDTNTTNCRAEVSGSQCLADGTCGCDADDDCGGPGSERVCDLSVGRCTYGCRGVGGNGCLPGEVCTSTDKTIGTCQPQPNTDGGVDGGVDGGDGGGDGGQDGGADGSDGPLTDGASDGATDGATDGPPRDRPRVDQGGRRDGGDGGNNGNGEIAGGGCSCTIGPDADPASGLGGGVLLSVVLFGLLWPRRRRRG